MSDKIKDADDHAFIEDEVCVALGKTRDEIMNMGLRELSDLCFSRGLEIEVDSSRALDGIGRLSFVMDRRLFAA